MKRPTPQEILRALADGKVVLTIYGRFRIKHTPPYELLYAPDGYAIYQPSEMNLDEPVFHAIRIIEPEPKTWRDKSDEENASAFERMIIGSPEEQSEYARDVAKDELLKFMAHAFAAHYRNQLGILHVSETIEHLIDRAFPKYK